VTGQVGDSGVVVLTAEGSAAPLTAPDRGEFAGESLFLTSRAVQGTWAQRVEAYRAASPLRAIIVASDGVLDDFTPPLGDVNQLFEQLVPTPDNPGSAGWLQDWLGYERRGSFDDRTIVILEPFRS
jgi:hypothetical protein